MEALVGRADGYWPLFMSLGKVLLVSTTLLVTAANQTKRSDVRLAIEALARVGQQVAGIVLTKTKHKASRSAYYRSEYKSARPSDR